MTEQRAAQAATSPEAVERLAVMLNGWTADGVNGDAQRAAATLRALVAERDAQKRRGDNHWETLRSIRDIARTSGDLERIIRWVTDAGSGYTESAEATLAKLSDERSGLRAERDAALREKAAAMGLLAGSALALASVEAERGALLAGQAALREALSGCFALLVTQKFEPDAGAPPMVKDGVWDRIVDAARAALAAAPQASAWRDIASAPRDGTTVDLWCSPVGWFGGQARRMTGYWWVDGIGWRAGLRADDLAKSKWSNATHWMPLPQPPAAQAGENG